MIDKFSGIYTLTCDICGEDAPETLQTVGWYITQEDKHCCNFGIRGRLNGTMQRLSEEHAGRV